MTGRYRHLTQPAPAMVEAGYAGQRPASGGAFVPVHLRTLLFIAVALLVGGGLFTLVPDLSASSTGESAPISEAGPALSEMPSTAGQSATDRSGQSPGANDDPAAASAAQERRAGLSNLGGISPVFTPEVQHWQAEILKWAGSFGLDPDIVATIMQIESCGDPTATSYAGAQGLFQVMPFHFAAGEDMFDPSTNASRGIAFYVRQLEYTGQDIYLSFAGYNGGYAASSSSFAYWANETQRYYSWASGIYNDAKAGLATSPTVQYWLEAGGRSACDAAARHLGI